MKNYRLITFKKQKSYHKKTINNFFKLLKFLFNHQNDNSK